MNDKPNILPWHREAAQDIGNQLAQWGDTDIAAIIARHDEGCTDSPALRLEKNKHAETLRLLEEAVEHIDGSAEYARQQSWTLTAELHRMKANQIRAHLTTMKGSQP